MWCTQTSALWLNHVATLSLIYLLLLIGMILGGRLHTLLLVKAIHGTPSRLVIRAARVSLQLGIGQILRAIISTPAQDDLASLLSLILALSQLSQRLQLGIASHRPVGDKICATREHALAKLRVLA